MLVQMRPLYGVEVQGVSRLNLARLYAQVLKYVHFAFCANLSRRGLQRVILQKEHLKLLHLSEADGDHQNFVAGKVELYQGEIY